MADMRSGFIRRSIALSLSVVVFCTHVLFANTLEKNMWEERRKALSVVAPSAFPSVSASKIQPKKEIAGNLSSLISTLSAYGTVREIKPGKGSSTIVFIQDVHGRLDAQKNIGEMLLQLLAMKPDTLIGLEGTAGDIPIEKFRKSTVEVNKDVGSFFLNTGLITGAEYAGFGAKTAPRLFGLEQKELYLKNVAAVKASLAKQQAELASIDIEKAKLEREKQKIYSPQMLAVDQKKRAYTDGSLAVGDYLLGLSQIVAAEKYPNVASFLKVWKLEKSLDFDRAERERAHFMSRLVQKIDRASLDELVRQGTALRSGATTVPAYYQLVKTVAAKSGASLSTVPEFNRYISYVLLADSIRTDAFLAEIPMYEDLVWDHLCKTREQKNLYRASVKAALDEKLVRLTLTAQEWNLRRGRPLQSFESFYEVADARNAALASNFSKKWSSFPSDVAVIIAGGFHSEGLTHLLADGNATFITVTPKLTKVDPIRDNDYLKVFAREKTPLSQLFDAPKISLVMTQPTLPIALGLNDDAAKAVALAGPLEEARAEAVDHTVKVEKPGQPTLTVAPPSEKALALSPQTFSGTTDQGFHIRIEPTEAVDDRFPFQHAFGKVSDFMLRKLGYADDPNGIREPILLEKTEPKLDQDSLRMIQAIFVITFLMGWPQYHMGFFSQYENRKLAKAFVNMTLNEGLGVARTLKEAVEALRKLVDEGVYDAGAFAAFERILPQLIPIYDRYEKFRQLDRKNMKVEDRFPRALIRFLFTGNYFGESRLDHLVHIKMLAVQPAEQKNESTQGKSGATPVVGMHESIRMAQDVDLNDKDILIVGPAMDGSSVIEIIERFPKIKSIHLLDVQSIVFAGIDDALIQLKQQKSEINLPPLFGYLANARHMPIPSETMDVVCHQAVVDDMFFSAEDKKLLGSEVKRVLRNGGIAAVREFVAKDFSNDGDPEMIIMHKGAVHAMYMKQARSKNQVEMRFVETDEQIKRVSELYSNGRTSGVTPVTNSPFLDLYLGMLKWKLNDGKGQWAQDFGFKKNLEGADVLVIGPNSDGSDIDALSKAFPGINSIHLVSAHGEVFNGIDAHLKKLKSAHPPVYGYRVNALAMPAELTGRFDLVIHISVVDSAYFSKKQWEQFGRQIKNVLKPNGLVISQVVTDADIHFDDPDMQLIDREGDIINVMFWHKKNDTENSSGSHLSREPTDKTYQGPAPMSLFYGSEFYEKNIAPLWESPLLMVMVGFIPIVIFSVIDLGTRSLTTDIILMLGFLFSLHRMSLWLAVDWFTEIHLRNGRDINDGALVAHWLSMLAVYFGFLIYLIVDIYNPTLISPSSAMQILLGIYGFAHTFAHWDQNSSVDSAERMTLIGFGGTGPKNETELKRAIFAAERAGKPMETLVAYNELGRFYLDHGQTEFGIKLMVVFLHWIDGLEVKFAADREMLQKLKQAKNEAAITCALLYERAGNIKDAVFTLGFYSRKQQRFVVLRFLDRNPEAYSLLTRLLRGAGEEFNARQIEDQAEEMRPLFPKPKTWLEQSLENPAFRQFAESVVASQDSPRASTVLDEFDVTALFEELKGQDTKQVLRGLLKAVKSTRGQLAKSLGIKADSIEFWETHGLPPMAQLRVAEYFINNFQFPIRQTLDFLRENETDSDEQVLSIEQALAHAEGKEVGEVFFYLFEKFLGLKGFLDELFDVPEKQIKHWREKGFPEDRRRPAVEMLVGRFGFPREQTEKVFGFTILPIERMFGRGVVEWAASQTVKPEAVSKSAKAIAKDPTLWAEVAGGIDFGRAVVRAVVRANVPLGTLSLQEFTAAMLPFVPKRQPGRAFEIPMTLADFLDLRQRMEEEPLRSQLRSALAIPGAVVPSSYAVPSINTLLAVIFVPIFALLSPSLNWGSPITYVFFLVGFFVLFASRSDEEHPLFQIGELRFFFNDLVLSAEAYRREKRRYGGASDLSPTFPNLTAWIEARQSTLKIRPYLLHAVDHHDGYTVFPFIFDGREYFFTYKNNGEPIESAADPRLGFTQLASNDNFIAYGNHTVGFLSDDLKIWALVTTREKLEQTFKLDSNKHSYKALWYDFDPTDFLSLARIVELRKTGIQIGINMPPRKDPPGFTMGLFSGRITSHGDPADEDLHSLRELFSSLGADDGDLDGIRVYFETTGQSYDLGSAEQMENGSADLTSPLDGFVRFCANVGLPQNEVAKFRSRGDFGSEPGSVLRLEGGSAAEGPRQVFPAIRSLEEINFEKNPRFENREIIAAVLAAKSLLGLEPDAALSPDQLSVAVGFFALKAATRLLPFNLDDPLVQERHDAMLELGLRYAALARQPDHVAEFSMVNSALSQLSRENREDQFDLRRYEIPLLVQKILSRSQKRLCDVLPSIVGVDPAVVQAVLSGYADTIGQFVEDGIRSGSLASMAVQISPEPLTQEQVFAQLGTNPVLVVIFDRMAEKTQAVLGMAARAVGVTVIGMEAHEDWLTEGGALKRGLIFNAETAEAKLVSFVNPIRPDAVQVLDLGASSMATDVHAMLTKFFTERGIPMVNPLTPDSGAAIASDKQRLFVKLSPLKLVPAWIALKTNSLERELAQQADSFVQAQGSDNVFRVRPAGGGYAKENSVHFGRRFIAAIKKLNENGHETAIVSQNDMGNLRWGNQMANPVVFRVNVTFGFPYKTELGPVFLGDNIDIVANKWAASFEDVLKNIQFFWSPTPQVMLDGFKLYEGLGNDVDSMRQAAVDTLSAVNEGLPAEKILRQASVYLTLIVNENGPPQWNVIHVDVRPNPQGLTPGAVGAWNLLQVRNLFRIGVYETVLLNALLFQLLSTILPQGPPLWGILLFAFGFFIFEFTALYALHFYFGVAQAEGDPITHDHKLSFIATLKAQLSFLSVVGLFTGGIEFWIAAAALAHGAANVASRDLTPSWMTPSWMREASVLPIKNGDADRLTVRTNGKPMTPFQKDLFNRYLQMRASEYSQFWFTGWSDEKLLLIDPKGKLKAAGIGVYEIPYFTDPTLLRERFKIILKTIDPSNEHAEEVEDLVLHPPLLAYWDRGESGRLIVTNQNAVDWIVQMSDTALNDWLDGHPVRLARERRTGRRSPLNAPLPQALREAIASGTRTLVFGKLPQRAIELDSTSSALSPELNELFAFAARHALERMGLWHEDKLVNAAVAEMADIVSGKVKQEHMADPRQAEQLNFHWKRSLGQQMLQLTEYLKKRKSALPVVAVRSVDRSSFLVRDVVVAADATRIYISERVLNAVRSSKEPVPVLAALLVSAYASRLPDEADSVHVLMRMMDPKDLLGQILKRLALEDKKRVISVKEVTELTAVGEKMRSERYSDERALLARDFASRVGLLPSEPIFSSVVPASPIKFDKDLPAVSLGRTPFRSWQLNLRIIKHLSSAISKYKKKGAYPLDISVDGILMIPGEMSDADLRTLLEKRDIRYETVVEVLEILADALMIDNKFADTYFGVFPIGRELRSEMSLIAAKMFDPLNKPLGRKLPLNLAEIMRMLRGVSIATYFDSATLREREQFVFQALHTSNISALFAMPPREPMSLIRGSEFYEVYIAPYWESPLLAFVVGLIPMLVFGTIGGGQQDLLAHVLILSAFVLSVRQMSLWLAVDGFTAIHLKKGRQIKEGAQAAHEWSMAAVYLSFIVILIVDCCNATPISLIRAMQILLGAYGLVHTRAHFEWNRSVGAEKRMSIIVHFLAAAQFRGVTVLDLWREIKTQRKNRNPAYFLLPPLSQIMSLAFFNNHQLLAAGYRGAVYRLDVLSPIKTPVVPILNEKAEILPVLSGSGRYLIRQYALLPDRPMDLYDFYSEPEANVNPRSFAASLLRHRLSYMELSPNGAYLAYATDNGVVWLLKTMEAIQPGVNPILIGNTGLPGPYWNFSFTPDSKQLAWTYITHHNRMRTVYRYKIDQPVQPGLNPELIYYQQERYFQDRDIAFNQDGGLVHSVEDRSHYVPPSGSESASAVSHINALGAFIVVPIVALILSPAIGTESFIALVSLILFGSTIVFAAISYWPMIVVGGVAISLAVIIAAVFIVRGRLNNLASWVLKLALGVSPILLGMAVAHFIYRPIWIGWSLTLEENLTVLGAVAFAVLMGIFLASLAYPTRWTELKLMAALRTYKDDPSDKNIRRLNRLAIRLTHRIQDDNVDDVMVFLGEVWPWISTATKQIIEGHLHDLYKGSLTLMGKAQGFIHVLNSKSTKVFPYPKDVSETPLTKVWARIFIYPFRMSLLFAFVFFVSWLGHVAVIWPRLESDEVQRSVVPLLQVLIDKNIWSEKDSSDFIRMREYFPQRQAELEDVRQKKKNALSDIKRLEFKNDWTFDDLNAVREAFDAGAGIGSLTRAALIRRMKEAEKKQESVQAKMKDLLDPARRTPERLNEAKDLISQPEFNLIVPRERNAFIEELGLMPGQGHLQQDAALKAFVVHSAPVRKNLVGHVFNFHQRRNEPQLDAAIDAAIKSQVNDPSVVRVLHVDLLMDSSADFEKERKETEDLAVRMLAARDSKQNPPVFVMHGETGSREQMRHRLEALAGASARSALILVENERLLRIEKIRRDYLRERGLGMNSYYKVRVITPLVESIAREDWKYVDLLLLGRVAPFVQLEIELSKRRLYSSHA